MASVKWLTSIQVTEGGWWGYQMDAYSFKRTADDPKALPLQQLPVRALMAPVGYPDFVSRTRIVAPGKHKIVGKAWVSPGLRHPPFPTPRHTPSHTLSNP